MYVYKQTEFSPYQLFTVGFFEDDRFYPESDHQEREQAARRASWLNGGSNASDINKELLGALQAMHKEFSLPDYEIWCDHSVGICNCNTLGILQKAKEAIDKATVAIQ